MKRALTKIISTLVSITMCSCAILNPKTDIAPPQDRTNDTFFEKCSLDDYFAYQKAFQEYLLSRGVSEENCPNEVYFTTSGDIHAFNQALFLQLKHYERLITKLISSAHVPPSDEEKATLRSIESSIIMWKETGKFIKMIEIRTRG